MFQHLLLTTVLLYFVVVKQSVGLYSHTHEGLDIDVEPSTPSPIISNGIEQYSGSIDLFKDSFVKVWLNGTKVRILLCGPDTPNWFAVGMCDPSEQSCSSMDSAYAILFNNGNVDERILGNHNSGETYDTRIDGWYDSEIGCVIIQRLCMDDTKIQASFECGSSLASQKKSYYKRRLIAAKGSTPDLSYHGSDSYYMNITLELCAYNQDGFEDRRCQRASEKNRHSSSDSSSEENSSTMMTIKWNALINGCLMTVVCLAWVF